jgi:hypothetical protein
LIDNKQKLQEAINKALDYHKKTAQLSKWRSQIELMEQSGLSKEDLILLAEAKAGNKAAIAKLAVNTNTDLYEISEEDAEQFKPTQHYPDEVEIAINDVIEEIESKPEVANQFAQFIPDMPDDFKQMLNSNPQVLKGFAEDIELGIAQVVYPQAVAHQAMYGGDFISNYKKVGMMLAQQGQLPQIGQPPAPSYVTEQPQANAQQPQQPNISPREKELRNKAAATTRRQQSGGKSFLADAQSIWDMSDEDFDKLSAEDLKRLK